MSRWKIFGRSKEAKTEEPSEPPEEESKEVVETEPEDKPIVEYRETLHTGKATSLKASKVEETRPANQRVWRDVDSIEDNIDTLHIKKAEKPVTDLDKKVDRLIEKRKKK